MLTLDVRACAAKEAAHEELELEQQVPPLTSIVIRDHHLETSSTMRFVRAE